MINTLCPLSTSSLLGLSTWVLGALFLVSITPVKGQTTDAVCTLAGWDWSFNSKQQSPCLVAAYLLAPCGHGQWNVPALKPTDFYTPPSTSMVNICQCSTVVYSLLSACGACQTDTGVAWSSWRTNCTDSMVSISKYPNAISPATAVPAWAYLDVVSSDKFDPASATRVINLPESTIGNNQVAATLPSSSTSSAPSTTSSSPTITAPTTQAPQVTNKSNNTSAIVGGTVGGVLGLGLIAVLILYLKRDVSQKPKRQPPSAAFASARATPDVAAAAGFRSASRHASPVNNPLASGGSNHGHGTQIPISVFQHGYSHGTPWSPPPPSSTPSRAISPTSAQSLLSTHNHARGSGRGGSIEYYRSTSSGSVLGRQVDLLPHSGSTSSMRSTIPMMQYAGTPAPPLATATPGYTRPAYGVGYGHGRNGSHPSQFSGSPEI